MEKINQSLKKMSKLGRLMNIKSLTYNQKLCIIEKMIKLGKQNLQALNALHDDEYKPCIENLKKTIKSLKQTRLYLKIAIKDKVINSRDYNM